MAAKKNEAKTKDAKQQGESEKPSSPPKAGGAAKESPAKDGKSDQKAAPKAADPKQKPGAKKGQGKEGAPPSQEKEQPPPPPPEDPLVIELRSQLEVQEKEAIRLREVLSIIGSGEGDLREAKIIELFKKNRYLNLCYEKERNRASKMVNQIKFLQEELLMKSNELQSTKGHGLKTTDAESAAEFWKDKHTKIVAKLQIVQARLDMNLGEVAKLQHIIKREVGDHVSPHKVLEEGGPWRGRAEQIALLKDQLDEANRKIRKLEIESENRPKSTLHNDEMTAIEMRHRNNMDVINLERRKELDTLATNYAALRDHWQMTKSKLDKTVARKNILEADIRNMKAKVGVLVSKSENDDLLINALTLELAAARQALGPPFPRPGGPLQLEHHYRCNKMAAKLTDLKHQCSEQEKEIELQDKIIDTLRATISDPAEEDWCTTELHESTMSEVTSEA